MDINKYLLYKNNKTYDKAMIKKIKNKKIMDY